MGGKNQDFVLFRFVLFVHSWVNEEMLFVANSEKTS